MGSTKPEIWLSTYHYPSSSRPGVHNASHQVQIFRTGNDVVIQSIPDDSGSYLFIRLMQDDNLLTGTWHEQTAPEGHYKGVEYYGAIQLQLSDDKKSMAGKWIGFSKSHTIQSGDWEIVRQ